MSQGGKTQRATEKVGGPVRNSEGELVGAHAGGGQMGISPALLVPLAPQISAPKRGGA